MRSYANTPRLVNRVDVTLHFHICCLDFLDTSDKRSSLARTRVYCEFFPLVGLTDHDDGCLRHFCQVQLQCLESLSLSLGTASPSTMSKYDSNRRPILNSPFTSSFIDHQIPNSLDSVVEPLCLNQLYNHFPCVTVCTLYNMPY